MNDASDMSTSNAAGVKYKGAGKTARIPREGGGRSAVAEA